MKNTQYEETDQARRYSQMATARSRYAEVCTFTT